MTTNAGSLTRLMPSIVLGEAFPPGRREPGKILAALDGAVTEGWYRRAEIPLPDTARERTAVRRLLCTGGLRLTCWASERLARDGLNLSSLDAAIRRRAVAGCAEGLKLASDCGADALGLLSGPDPGEQQRPAAMQALAESLTELGRVATDAGPLTVVLEPLDRAAHKRGLVGPTPDAVALMTALRKETDRVRLGWDSGHTVLNGEDAVESLRTAAPHTFQLHLSNPVTDPADPRFGDQHHPVGAFGTGTPAAFAQILAAARASGFAAGGAISVALEVRPPAGAEPEAVLRQTEAQLRELLSGMR